MDNIEVQEKTEDVLNDLGTPVDTELNIIVPDNEVVREGMQEKADSAFSESFLGVQEETKPETTATADNPQEPQKKATKSEATAEARTAMLALDTVISWGTFFGAKFFGKEVSLANLQASEKQIDRLVDHAYPLYEKYKHKFSVEFLFIFALFSIYAPKIAGELMNADSDVSEQAEKHLHKQAVKKTPSFDPEEWKGNPLYFQTGKKAGTLKSK